MTWTKTVLVDQQFNGTAYEQRAKYQSSKFDFLTMRETALDLRILETQPRVQISDRIDFDELRIGNSPLWPWLYENVTTKTRLRVMVFQGRYMSFSMFPRPAIEPVVRLLIGFSDPSTALMFKMAWGGKLIDKRMISSTPGA